MPCSPPGARSLGTSHRQAPVKRLVGVDPRRARPSCSGCPTAGRSCSATAAPRCSGTSPRSGSSTGAASTSCSASSRRSSPRPRAAAPHLGEPIVVDSRPGDHPRARRRRRRRRVRPHPQRDVDRRGDGAAPPGRAPTRRARRGRRHLGRRRPAVGPGRGRRVLLRPAEVLRLRRRPVARGLLAGRRRRGSSAIAASPIAGGRRRSTSAIALDQQPRSTRRTTRRPSPRWCCSTPRCAGCSPTAGSTWCAKRSRDVGRPPLRLGRGRASGRRRSSPTRPSARASSARSTSTRTIDADDGVARRCGPTAIVDTDSYRKLGRNQLRIGMFPAIEPGRRRGADRVHRPPRRRTHDGLAA